MNTLAKWIFPLAVMLASVCSGVHRVEGDPASAALVPAVPLASSDDAADPLVVPTSSTGDASSCGRSTTRFAASFSQRSRQSAS